MPLAKFCLANRLCARSFYAIGFSVKYRFGSIKTSHISEEPTGGITESVKQWILFRILKFNNRNVRIHSFEKYYGTYISCLFGVCVISNFCYRRCKSYKNGKNVFEVNFCFFYSAPMCICFKMHHWIDGITSKSC